MTVYKLDKGAHSVYSLHYHLILVVKYRRKALYNEVIRERLKQIIYEMAEKWQREKNSEMAIEIVAQEPGEDHHHILFKAAPNTALTKVINSIKGASARVLRNEFPETKKILWGDAFWAPSYFLATTGQVSLDVLKAYVESQESKRESTYNEELKGRGFKEAKWPGLIIATQDTELPKDVIETIKTNCKTSYEELIKNCGGEVVKLGEGGATFDPCTEFTKLPYDEKDKLTAEAIKIIEKREEERKLK